MSMTAISQSFAAVPVHYDYIVVHGNAAKASARTIIVVEIRHPLPRKLDLSPKGIDYMASPYIHTFSIRQQQRSGEEAYGRACLWHSHLPPFER